MRVRSDMTQLTERALKQKANLHFGSWCFVASTIPDLVDTVSVLAVSISKMLLKESMSTSSYPLSAKSGSSLPTICR